MDENGQGNQPIEALLHELRQPLNTIILSCANVQNRIRVEQGDIDSDYVISKMEVIMTSVRNMAIIIEKIDIIQKNRT